MAAPEQRPVVIDDRFVLEAEHKRGGMGTLYRARDLVTSRRVAVKVLHAAGSESERFVREATFLSNLAHGSLVSYVAHGATAEGVPYLAMEWLEGEDVAERLARQPLSLEETLRLARGAARGLAVAHRAGVVHRDLKPSNLFLRERRVDDVVLLDLGIARQVGATGLTRTGSILGTPSYMSPEQAQGQADVRPAADVFSLGCVLFECLSGDPPFRGAHVFTVLAKVLFEETPRLRELRPEIPAAVEALVDRMLAKDPGRRLPDAAAVVAAIGALGPLPHLGPPGANRAPPRPTPAEQELVSVVLATPVSSGTGSTGAEEGPAELDLSTYGAERRRLADGTLLVTLAQRGGAATDLAIRAARCALRVRAACPAWRIVLATGRGIPSERFLVGDAVDRAGSMLRAHEEIPAGAVCLDEVTAGLLDARFRTRRVAERAFLLEGEDPSIDPTRKLLGRPTACVGREQELGTLELALRACVEDSTPRALLVVGAPGMGKSRLRHELARRVQAHGDPPLLLLGQGDPIRATTSCGLLGGALARECGVRPGAAGLIAILIVLNVRGVKESVTVLAPIFMVFVVTHIVMLLYGIGTHADRFVPVVSDFGSGIHRDVSAIGVLGIFLLFLRAYSLGGGTYTGIEAVSNGLQIMREPRVQTGKRTMVYMATSLAFTAGVLLLCYLLIGVKPVEGKTLNAVVADALFGGWPMGKWIAFVTIFSEGALLLVAAQAGFVDGPRVMANMAIDSWFPHRFAALSERLSMRNGILLMGIAAIALLFYTGGSVSALVVMYSINVFITFSLSQLGMSRFFIQRRREDPQWLRHLSIHLVGLVLCVTILIITTFEKFTEGGWMTLLITSVVIVLCYLIKGHYLKVRQGIAQLDETLLDFPTAGPVNTNPVNRNEPTAIQLVSGYSGFGVHTLLSILTTFPKTYKNVIFVSVAVIDSGSIKGAEEMAALEKSIQSGLEKYVDLARRLGFAADYRMAVGTDVVESATGLCQQIAEVFPRSTVFTGQLTFRLEKFYHKMLHNETAFAIQRRLQWDGITTVILPIRVRV